MKQEVKRTSRQEWTHFSGEIQQDVNSILDNARIEIEAANLALAELYETDPEAAGEYAANIVEYLDDRWGYKGDVFMVTGKWHEPMFGSTDEGVMSRHQEKDAFNDTISNGFMVKPVENDDGDEAPRVGMSFIVGSTRISTPSIQGSFDILAFAEPHEVSLQYMRPGETAVVSTSVEELAESLQRADSLLYLYTNHKDSAFYQTSAKKQEKFIRSVIDIAEAALPAPDSMDRAYLCDVSTDLIYMNHTEHGFSSASGEEVEDRMRITGEILGVTIADVLHDGFGKKYNSPDELGATGAGLCLIVSPRDTNFAIPEGCGEYILMPLRAMDSVPLAVQ